MWLMYELKSVISHNYTHVQAMKSWRRSHVVLICMWH